MNYTFSVTVAALHVRFCLLADKIVVCANRQVKKAKKMQNIARHLVVVSIIRFIITLYLIHVVDIQIFNMTHTKF
jgi:predicted house-cleaning NTP pyrophosphatase (Maf/HAM1 superfamily)